MKATRYLYYVLPKYIEPPECILYYGDKHILAGIEEAGDGYKEYKYVCEIDIPTKPLENLQKALYGK